MKKNCSFENICKLLFPTKCLKLLFTERLCFIVNFTSDNDLFAQVKIIQNEKAKMVKFERLLIYVLFFCHCKEIAAVRKGLHSLHRPNKTFYYTRCILPDRVTFCDE